MHDFVFVCFAEIMNEIEKICENMGKIEKKLKIMEVLYVF